MTKCFTAQRAANGQRFCIDFYYQPKRSSRGEGLICQFSHITIHAMSPSLSNVGCSLFSFVSISVPCANAGFARFPRRWGLPAGASASLIETSRTSASARHLLALRLDLALKWPIPTSSRLCLSKLRHAAPRNFWAWISLP